MRAGCLIGSLVALLVVGAWLTGVLLVLRLVRAFGEGEDT